MRAASFRPRRAGEHLRKEDGYVLALVALLFIPLLAFTGFAVDLGAWYARASKMQRAADAAALAGVQELPILANAQATAKGVAAQNGFVDGVNGITVTAAQVPDPTAKLKVTINDTKVDQAFTKAFRNGVTIERTGTAQYLKPIAMGSPKNFLGTGDLTMQSGGFKDNFWLAVSGPCASKENGDRIQAKTDANWPGGSFRCTGGSTVVNTEYNPDGYFYAVEFKQNVSGSVAVQIYDPALCNNSGSGDPGDSTSNSFTTTYTMRDNSSFDPTQTAVLTTKSFTTSSSCKSWYTLYTINNPTKGVYYVQVQSSSGSTNNHGSNGFALRAQVGGSWSACSADSLETQGGAAPYNPGCPQVYGYGNLGVYANLTGSAAQFYLAQVGPDYNNKQVELSLFDPGEGAVAMQILDPNDNPVDFKWAVSCYDANPSPCSDGTVAPLGGWTGTSASILVTAPGPNTGQTIPKAIDLWGNGNSNPQPGPGRLSGSKYSDRLLKLTVQLPADINAAFGGRQWYKIKYFVGTSSTDRTTWGVLVKGAPVRLIPNP